MNYTIISTQDLQTGQIIDIVKDGSTYNVDFTNKEKFITKKAIENKENILNDKWTKWDLLETCYE